LGAVGGAAVGAGVGAGAQLAITAAAAAELPSARNSRRVNLVFFSSISFSPR